MKCVGALRSLIAAPRKTRCPKWFFTVGGHPGLEWLDGLRTTPAGVRAIERLVGGAWIALYVKHEEPDGPEDPEDC